MPPWELKKSKFHQVPHRKLPISAGVISPLRAVPADTITTQQYAIKVVELLQQFKPFRPDAMHNVEGSEKGHRILSFAIPGRRCPHFRHSRRRLYNIVTIRSRPMPTAIMSMRESIQSNSAVIPKLPKADIRITFAHRGIFPAGNRPAHAIF